MQIISVNNLKGGTGKTSLLANLAFTMTSKGYRVLLIDLDHNNNLTNYALTIEDDLDENRLNFNNIYSYLFKGDELEDVIHKGNFCDIIPATIELVHSHKQSTHSLMSYFKLRETLTTRFSDEYDFVLLDTPGSLTFEFMCSLYTCDQMIIPFNYHFWSLACMKILSSEIQEVSDIRKTTIDRIMVPINITKAELGEIIETRPHLYEKYKLDYSPLYIANNGIVRSSEIVSTQHNKKPIRTKGQTYERFVGLIDELLGERVEV